MKPRIRHGAACALGAFLFLASGTLCAQTQALQSGLEELFAQAENHNTTLKRLQSAFRESGLSVDVARANQLPELHGEASVSYLGNARLWNRHFGESTSAPMPHYGNNFLLKASQVVYSGGAVSGGVQLARQQVRHRLE